MSNKKQFFNTKTKKFHVLEPTEKGVPEFAICEVRTEPAENVPITNGQKYEQWKSQKESQSSSESQSQQSDTLSQGEQSEPDPEPAADTEDDFFNW